MNNPFFHWGITIFQGAIIFGLGLWHIAFPENSWIAAAIVFLLTGIAGLAEWILSRDFDRHTGDFLWAIATGLSGFFLLFGRLFGHEIQIILMAIWMIISGIWLFTRGQSLQWISELNWGITITGAIVVLFGLLNAFNPQITTTLLKSLPLLITGLNVFAIALIKKKIIEDY